MRTLPKNRICIYIWKAKSSFANWYRNKLLNFLETVFSSIYKVPIIAALMFTVFKCGAQSSAASAKVARGARSLGRQQTSAHSNSWKIHTCLYMYKPARQRGALQSRTVGAENCCCMLSGVCVCRRCDGYGRQSAAAQIHSEVVSRGARSSLWQRLQSVAIIQRYLRHTYIHTSI